MRAPAQCWSLWRALLSALLSITRLALMSYSQNADNIKRGIEAIQRKISSYPPRNHELANMLVDSPPDERMGLENADCTSDVLERLGGFLE